MHGEAGSPFQAELQQLGRGFLRSCVPACAHFAAAFAPLYVIHGNIQGVDAVLQCVTVGVAAQGSTGRTGQSRWTCTTPEALRSCLCPLRYQFCTILCGLLPFIQGVKAALQCFTVGVAAQAGVNRANRSIGVRALTHTAHGALRSCVCPLRCHFCTNPCALWPHIQGMMSVLQDVTVGVAAQGSTG